MFACMYVLKCIIGIQCYTHHTIPYHTMSYRIISYMYMHVHTYAHVHMYVCCILMCTDIMYTYTRACTSLHTYIYIYTCMYICMLHACGTYMAAFYVGFHISMHVIDFLKALRSRDLLECDMSCCLFTRFRNICQ